MLDFVPSSCPMSSYLLRSTTDVCSNSILMKFSRTQKEKGASWSISLTHFSLFAKIALAIFYHLTCSTFKASFYAIHSPIQFLMTCNDRMPRKDKIYWRARGYLYSMGSTGCFNGMEAVGIHETIGCFPFPIKWWLEEDFWTAEISPSLQQNQKKGGSCLDETRSSCWALVYECSHESKDETSKPAR